MIQISVAMVALGIVHTQHTFQAFGPESTRNMLAAYSWKMPITPLSSEETLAIRRVSVSAWSLNIPSLLDISCATAFAEVF